jgi:hypothetical protein
MVAEHVFQPKAQFGIIGRVADLIVCGKCRAGEAEQNHADELAAGEERLAFHGASQADDPRGIEGCLPHGANEIDREGDAYADSPVCFCLGEPAQDEFV